MRIRTLVLAMAAVPFCSVQAEDAQLDTVEVTATPTNEALSDMLQPTLVLSGEELDRQRAESLGETLAQQPGVNSASFGASVGRPVIRGLGGARVKVLQSGMEAVDASSVSPDHAVAVHTHGARQIEVLRGPATLLYGNGAFGGVVNVVDDRIPHADEHDGTETSVRAGYNSVNNGKEIALQHQGKKDAWHWHVNASEVSADDYNVPKDAGEIHVEEDGVEKHKAESKRLKNSDIDHNRQLALGGSYEFAGGDHVGIAVSRLESKFGLPGHGHNEEHEEEEGAAEEEHHEEEGPARVDLKQTRVDLDALIRQPFSAAKSLSLRLAISDYEHSEGHEEIHSEEEAAEEGHEEHGTTTFRKKAQDLRAELVLAPMTLMGRNFDQVVGTQLSQQEFSAIGKEALVPTTDTTNAGVFWLGEQQWQQWTVEIGARLDQIKHDPKKPGSVAAACGFSVNEYRQRTFNNHSLSLGLIHQLNESWQLATALTSAQRAPATEELFSCGAHESTLSYDIGNPELKSEQALNLDLSLRKNEGRVTGSLNLYRNAVDDFIYQNAVVSGGKLQKVDELQAYRFQQNKATLTGGELQVSYALADFWSLTAMADTVRGKLNSGDYIPRMPADRAGLGVHYLGLNWGGFVQQQWVSKQDRLARFGRAANGTELKENETDGYQLLNAGVSYRIDSAVAEYRLDLTATNLLDEEVRYHTSFVKNTVPQPGRGVKLALNARF